MKLGEIIKDWRHLNKIGIREISKQIGISTATLSRMENGKSIDMISFHKILIWLTRG